MKKTLLLIIVSTFSLLTSAQQAETKDLESDKAAVKTLVKPFTYNFDYFTLIKKDGSWKILNGSYVSVPIEN